MFGMGGGDKWTGDSAWPASKFSPDPPKLGGGRWTFLGGPGLFTPSMRGHFLSSVRGYWVFHDAFFPTSVKNLIYFPF